MKYKTIPSPTLAEGEAKRPLHRVESGVYIDGWEIGRYVGEGEEKTWEKLREAMSLSPEEESAWQYEQEHQPATVLDHIESQVTYTALMTDTLIEEDEDDG